MEVMQAMKATEGIDTELLRSHVEVAMMKGVRGGKLEEAIAAVAQYDRQQAVVAMMSTLFSLCTHELALSTRPGAEARENSLCKKKLAYAGIRTPDLTSRRFRGYQLDHRGDRSGRGVVHPLPLGGREHAPPQRGSPAGYPQACGGHHVGSGRPVGSSRGASTHVHEEEERQRQALEEEMVDLQNEVDEAETAADSCAASLEKLDEQTVAVLTAVEKTVGAQSTRLGEIGDVALSFTRQLLDDLSGCRQQVVEVEERAMDRLEETMASEEESTYMHSSASCVQACLERSQHHRRERSSGEFVHRRGARETQAAFRACAAGLERLDSQSLDLARFLADKAMQAGAPVSIANAVEAPKPPGYGLLDSLFRPRGVSDDAMVKIVPSRVG
ncbi:unnamed protein product [Ectocarpus sp. CCAP 1310/34]|nr:unnamed protein product [Ectocarpus sp. CCAP 1310/34]